MMRLLGFLLLVAGCNDNGVITDHYVPFDPAQLSAAQNQVKALGALRQALEAKDFNAIKTAYQSTFQAQLKALAASHSYVSEGAGLGIALDQQATAAIDAGLAASDTTPKEVAEEQVQTIISRWTFETIYGELKKADMGGWDRAFGYYGRSTDGKTSDGVAATADERDVEFGVRKNDVVFHAFIDGRNLLASRGSVAVDSATIDQTITQVFGLSARHEFGEAAGAIAKMTPTDAVEGFAVGSGLITFLRDYMKTQPGGADAVATIEAELQKGDPGQPQTMSQVAFTKVVAAIDKTFGFSF
jgi:hypothetical protein